MGDLNLLFLLILWVLLLAVARVVPKRLLVALAVLFAIAMTVPPFPNYLFVTKDGHISFYFNGLKGVFDGALWRLAFFLIFYIVFFVAVALLVGVGRNNSIHDRCEQKL